MGAADQGSEPSLAVADRVDLSRTPTPVPPTFKSSLLALATTASLGGIPAIAALAQDIAKEMVTLEQEEASAQSVADQLSSLPRVTDRRVEQAWSQVRELSGSPFTAPVVVQSLFVDAQSDARGMYLGTATLAGDLADDSVLKFTLAHEEGHRVNRDTAGSKGLETLLEICRDDSELFPVAFKALNAGRHENERQADLFAARLLKDSTIDRSKVREFLAATPGDLQHPEGSERAAMVEAAWS